MAGARTEGRLPEMYACVHPRSGAGKAGTSARADHRVGDDRVSGTEPLMRAGASARTGSATLPLAVGAAAAAAALALAAPTGVLGDVARAVTFVSTLAATGLCVFARAVHDRAGTV